MSLFHRYISMVSFSNTLNMIEKGMGENSIDSAAMYRTSFVFSGKDTLHCSYVHHGWKDYSKHNLTPLALSAMLYITAVQYVFLPYLAWVAAKEPDFALVCSTLSISVLFCIGSIMIFSSCNLLCLAYGTIVYWFLKAHFSFIFPFSLHLPWRTSPGWFWCFVFPRYISGMFPFRWSGSLGRFCFSNDTNDLLVSFMVMPLLFLNLTASYASLG